MRDVVLHRLLESYAVDASGRLSAEADNGAEVPFELAAERRRGRAPLYCYTPLTGAFIRSRAAALAQLPSHDPAVRVLAGCESLDGYLQERGIVAPVDAHGRCVQTLHAFLDRVFAHRTGFGFEPADFEAAYAELELAVYAGQRTTTVIAPVLGIVLDAGTSELALADGVSLIRGEELPEAPAEAVWGDGAEPRVLVTATVHGEDADVQGGPEAVAHERFRRLLRALRLFERGSYAIGPAGWARTETGAWRIVGVGVGGRPQVPTLVPADKADELRAFWRLTARGAPTAELAWALARFEMACERETALDALTDDLLALRALLEPEGPASGRLAQRLSVICARPEQRAALAQRAARAIELERAAIEGRVGAREDVDGVERELSEHLRAVLRDALCGHLEPDLVAVADELLADAA
ncbi:MAG: hypothetical protein ACRDMJ_15320, partial [Solirubrobacteraceae bacterium]